MAEKISRVCWQWKIAMSSGRASSQAFLQSVGVGVEQSLYGRGEEWCLVVKEGFGDREEKRSGVW